MISLENARELIAEKLQPLLSGKTIETVKLWEAGGRVLAQTVIAAESVPPFDRSLVDGFALLAADTKGARESDPVKLEIVDTIAAGAVPRQPLAPGKAAKIFTGAPLPEGADSVIKKEEVIETGGTPGSAQMVMIKRKVAAGEGISFRGEDIAAGEHLLNAGTVLTAAHLGVLATLGFDPVPVYAKPKIGIFATGNELVEACGERKQGQIRVSNIYTLAEIVRQAGGIPVNLGLVKDRVADVLKVYEKAQRLELPLVISTGGTASGAYDFVREAMETSGALRLFSKVAIRPGAPVVAAVKEGQLLFGLSGNPGGAAVAMYLLLYPLIARLSGSYKELERSQGRITKPLVARGGVRRFIWAASYEQDNQIIVTPFENQFCGTIKNHAQSNCLIELPAGEVEIAIDDPVVIWKLP
ncbi:MAG: molybdopterin molybdotransferase MoeA [Firmicutes bacterium]|nr:molybdopterin molybdotransferase MoeA [Bacillota bacterium]